MGRVVRERGERDGRKGEVRWGEGKGRGKQMVEMGDKGERGVGEGVLKGR